MGLKIAFIGTRGVPARYGGFETCAEEVGKRLVLRGHEVRVYCRSRYYRERPAAYEGMSLVYRPAFPSRNLETLSHTVLSLLHAAFRKTDVCLVFNTANSPFLWIARLAGKKVVSHTDGLEWERDKWRGLGARYLEWATKKATRLKKIALISDSREIQEYYRRAFGRETHFIAYGAPLVESRDPALLARYGLVQGEYFLQMARFEPENNVHLTVEAFSRVKTGKKLVLVGGASYDSAYVRALTKAAAADPRVVPAGFLYDRAVVNELLTNAYAYIHGNEAGGTNPGLLQAMGAGCAVLARDVPFNREVCGREADYFADDAADLAGRIRKTLENPDDLVRMKNGARRIARERYDWEAVADDYERLLLSVSSRPDAGAGATRS